MRDHMLKALFLLKLALGLRSSQLYVLTHQPTWKVFVKDESKVSLVPNPLFLAKNEREMHRLEPIVPQVWVVVVGAPHTLCPVDTLFQYIEATGTASSDRLFVWPDTLSTCSKALLTRSMCQFVAKAYQGALPQVQDVCKYE